ncbi:hypothetical protein LQW54_011326 [Pestalotiopsis sp. IQ-011]
MENLGNDEVSLVGGKSITSILTPSRPEQAESDDAISAATPQAQTVERGTDWETGTLQPSGLLNHVATEGRFSLQSILSPQGSSVSDALNENATASFSPEDPVQLGHINLSIAESLFDNFFKVLNPYISQLDPVLHTFDYVRKRSSFLFTAILAAAAKSFNTALYPGLHGYAESLLADNFRLGRKSIEIAQAVLILTYWKEPEDTRAWIFLGYTIRMGMDLGWHRLAPYAACEQLPLTETQKRETRNVQRTWYILFVYDRSISLQTGKPWMIERSTFIESIESWCRDSLATDNDRLLGAFVTLRLLSSEVFKLLGPKSSKVVSGPLHSIESLLAIIKIRIEEWEQRWIHCVSSGQIEPQVSTAIATAARVFSQQASPPGSSCTLQAKFLERIMSDFETMRQEQRLQKIQARTMEENTHASNTVPLLDENGASRPAETVCQDVTCIDDIDDRNGLHPVRQEFSFAEDEMWADMFANAGFNYQEGVFFA